uniref:BACON domain-containing protein n=1 Tax=Solibacter usitatus (strain Ellin6076) TaxID=234267 RepID=Q026Q6_SOLUE
MNIRRAGGARRHWGCVILTLLTGRLAAADLALQISNETVPAGGWAQIKVSALNPQLVATGRIIMKFDPAIFGSIADLSVFSAQGDAQGIATVSGQSLDVTFYAKAGGIAQLTHLPVLTVTVPVLDTARAGTVSPITLDASQVRWTDAANKVFPVTVTPGSVTVGGVLSVKNLAPGGGLLPAGALVRVNGTGITAATTAGIDGVSVSRVQFVSASELDLTLGGPADLTGKKLTLRNPDGSQTEYFSNLPSTTDDPPPSRFTNIRPLLSMQQWTGASVTFTERGGAIAIQNPNSTPVDVILQQQSAVLVQASQTTVTIPPGAMNIYPTGAVAGTGFRAFAVLPVRMLGLGFPPPGAAIFPAPPFPAVPAPQQLTPSPAAVALQWQLGTAAPAPVTVNLTPTGANSVFAFQVTAPAAPFSVSPAHGTSTASLTVAVNTAGLNAGTYTGSIVVTPEGPNAVVTTIPLSFTVSAAALIATSAAKLEFTGPDDYALNLKVQSNGNPVAFTAAASDGAAPHWLNVTPSSGATPATLTVAVNSKALAEGNYTGQIVITGPNNTVTVRVSLNVSAANIFSFSPPAITFSVQTGAAIPPTQTVLVYGPSSGAAFSVSTGSGGNWLSVIVTPAGQLGAVITANPTGLKAGTYNGKVTLTSPASSLPAVFPVTLVVWDTEPVLTVTPSHVEYTVALGDNPNIPPGPQTIQVTSGGVPLNFTEGFPEVVGSGALFTTPASVPAPSSGIATLGTAQYDITINAGSQKVVVPVTTVVTTGPLTPPMLGTVVNAASQVVGPVAPGEIVTIYGFGAGPSNTAGFTLDPSGKVAASLNGVQVLFDGTPAPMIYGSATQANVIVPYEVAGQATTTLALKFGGLTSAAWAIPVAATSPGIFAALNQDNTLNAAANPAPRGSIVQIFATGEGQTSPAGITGSVTGTNLKTQLADVKVTIGGEPAPVQFAGSAANAVAGLFQVNAVVPQSAAAGSLELRLSVGGVETVSSIVVK